MMRKSIDRLLGERWGSVVRGYWTWLRDRSLERGGQAAIREAAQSYRAMQGQVEHLARTVREQERACERAERLYLAKVNEYRACQLQLQQARQQRDADQERSALYRAQRLDRILPQLMDNVERGDRYLQAARQTLQQEIERLETYRYQLHELVECDRANQTLSMLLQVSSPQGQKSRDRFDRAKAAIEDRQQYHQALYDLTESAQDTQSQAPEASLEESDRVPLEPTRSPVVQPQPVPPLRRPKRLP